MNTKAASDPRSQGKAQPPSRAMEIEQLEIRLRSSNKPIPDEFNTVVQLADLYILENREVKATPLIKRAVQLFTQSRLSASEGVALAEVMHHHWMMDRFVNKGNMRVNVSDDRRKIFNDLLEITDLVHKMSDSTEHHQVVSLRLAHLKESAGSFREALTMLSDLIAAQASNGVDLSFIIFKAAILLKHVGENAQAIEYLEYLQDDPPVASGFSKMHVLAFLTLVYEQSGEKYRVFLPKTYRALSTSMDEEDAEANKAKKSRRLIELVKNKSVQSSSELWELLAFQALDKCEYVLAAEFLKHASIKSPTKGSVLHCLIEVLFLLGEKEAAGKLGDKAMVLLPSSAELRNLLLLIDPDKWGDKLRFVGPTAATEREEQLQLTQKQPPPPSRTVIPDLPPDEETGPLPPLPSQLKSPEAKEKDKSKAAKPTEKANKPVVQDQKISINEPIQKATKSTDVLANEPTAQDPKPLNKEEKQREKRSTGIFSMIKSTAISAFGGGKTDDPIATPAKTDAPAIITETPPPQISKNTTKTENKPIESTTSETKTKPPKVPAINEDTRRVLNLVLSGNTKVHYYDETLSTLASIKNQSLSEEKKKRYKK